MDDRAQIAWLYRRLGFGLAPGQLDELVGLGASASLERLVRPEQAGLPVGPDPWDQVDLSSYDPKGGGRRALWQQSIKAWLVAMAATPRPFEEWVRWFWHGHFVSTLRVVKDPRLMVEQLRTFGELGLGDFRSLLHAVTIDPAMLVYLDGRTSTKGAVNENYGREVLELFALGIGNYTEDDVRAGAVALTGWSVRRDPAGGAGAAVFTAKAHDDTPQRYLGRDGVHDLDTVVDAIVAHPACGPYITTRLCRAILGPDLDSALVARLSTDFVASGLQIRPLIEAIATAGMSGAGAELLAAPVPWTVAAVKATAATPTAVFDGVGGAGLLAAGQVPMDAPNVAGWPSSRAWLSSSATIARLDTAAGIAALAPGDGPLRRASRSGDVAALADGLGHPDGFGSATTDALAALRTSDPSGVATLAVAMASPEAVMA